MSEHILKLAPKNWQDFQHYKDRCPPWIKLHRDLLNNKDYMRLPTASKALAPLLWLLASESKEKNGAFNASTDELEFRLRMNAKDIETGRKALVHAGFFVIASSVLAECVQLATPERETEAEGETEESFNNFYFAYPKKVGKPAALKAWKAAKIKPDQVAAILSDIETRSQSRDWMKEDGQFVPNPATYINQRRWEDIQYVAKPSGILAGAI